MGLAMGKAPWGPIGGTYPIGMGGMFMGLYGII